LEFLDISSCRRLTPGIFYKTDWNCAKELKTLIMNHFDMTSSSPPTTIIKPPCINSIEENHKYMFEKLESLTSLQNLVMGGTQLELKLEYGLNKLSSLIKLESWRVTMLVDIMEESTIRWFANNTLWPNLKRAKFENNIVPLAWYRYLRRER